VRANQHSNYPAAAPGILGGAQNAWRAAGRLISARPRLFGPPWTQAELRLNTKLRSIFDRPSLSDRTGNNIFQEPAPRHDRSICDGQKRDAGKAGRARPISFRSRGPAATSCRPMALRGGQAAGKESQDSGTPRLIRAVDDSCRAHPLGSPEGHPMISTVQSACDLGPTARRPGRCRSALYGLGFRCSGRPRPVRFSGCLSCSLRSLPHPLATMALLSARPISMRVKKKRAGG